MRSILSSALGIRQYDSMLVGLHSELKHYQNNTLAKCNIQIADAAVFSMKVNPDIIKKYCGAEEMSWPKIWFFRCKKKNVLSHHHDLHNRVK